MFVVTRLIVKQIALPKNRCILEIPIPTVSLVYNRKRTFNGMPLGVEGPCQHDKILDDEHQRACELCTAVPTNLSQTTHADIAHRLTISFPSNRPHNVYHYRLCFAIARCIPHRSNATRNVHDRWIAITHRVALRHQQFRQIGSILSGNTSYESNFTSHCIA